VSHGQIRVWDAKEIAHMVLLGHVPLRFHADGDGRNSYAIFHSYVRADLTTFREAVTRVHSQKSEAVRTQGVLNHVHDTR
jgi:hypothetical protein